MCSRRTALLALSVVCAFDSLAAQPDSVRTPPEKVGSVATIWAVVIPGAGHIYSGERTRGLLIIAAVGTSFLYGFGDGRCTEPYTDVRSCEVTENGSTAALILSVGIYGYSVWDSHRAARRTNQRRSRVRQGVTAVSPHWQLTPDASGGLRVGLGVRHLFAGP